MSLIPSELYYTNSHEWARLEADGSLTIGITDHAQEALGDLVYIELPEIGLHVDANKEFVVVESVKAASDVYAPVSGTVSAVNRNIADAPETVNADAYAAWLVRIQPDNPADIETLLTAEAYRSIAEDG
jgi:glycine cleavage system H protein